MTKYLKRKWVMFWWPQFTPEYFCIKCDCQLTSDERLYSKGHCPMCSNYDITSLTLDCVHCHVRPKNNWAGVE